MSLADTYSRIPYNLSGSMSKNRFRQELFWGVSRMFDLFDKDDYCVIFDYKCDVEVHFRNSIEFYQIKTHKVQSPYKFTDLKKIPKGSQSIMAKLFILKDEASSETSIKCALVSNAYFQIGKTTKSDVEKFCFDELDEKSQNIIKKALQDELKRSEVDLTNLHYIYTSMNLLDPQNDLRGKITGSFEKIKGCEPVRPNSLYRLITETIQERACYELMVCDYEELVKRKGMTKAELNDILDRYIEESDDSVEQAFTILDQQMIPAREKKMLKAALAKVVELMYNSSELQRKEPEVAAYIEEVVDTQTTEDIVELLLKHFESSFSIEYTDQDKYCFMLLIVKRWEGGRYE